MFSRRSLGPSKAHCVRLCFGIALVAPILSATPVTLTRSGWTITADTEAAQLIIAHNRVGVILRNVKLGQIGPAGLTSAEHWFAALGRIGSGDESTAHARQSGDDQLIVKTESPRMVWLFDASENQLRISTTSAGGVLTAQARAPSQRIPARLLDREGTPVDWRGTGEIRGWGGAYTHNASFLPHHNPEVAYFALGQVSASGLHSLFDRPSDVAIDFADNAYLSRNTENPDLLEVRIPVPGNTAMQLIPDHFTKTLGLPFYVPYDDSHFPAAPMVWSSWDSYYEGVKESDIVQNADWIATHLLPYGFQFVQLDDGYDRGPKGEHSWTTNWDQAKFPHGPKWLADYIHSKGLRPGIWLVPNSHGPSLAQHPDWYLYYKDGKIVLDYDTPALDSTNPAVLDFLQQEFNTLAGWGYEYFKIDGDFAIPKYVPNTDLSRLYDKNADPLLAYRRRLSVIRKAIGADRFIEGCIAGTPLNGVGYVDLYFNGDDLYDNWQGMYSLFSSINDNVFFNHIAAYTMPGEGMALEPHLSFEEGAQKRNAIAIDIERDREFPLTGFGTTLAEARTTVSLVALTGVVYSIASVMTELPEERVQLLQKTLPTLPILPVDLFSRGTETRWDKFKLTTPDEYIHNYPEVIDLKVNAPAGTYDVVAMTNWRSWTDRRDLAFDPQLGISSVTSFVAFDFWNQKIEGVFKNRMSIDIAPHDTRVFQLHALLNHPQLVGNSRHISGSYSVLKVNWNDTEKTLSGSAQGVPGQPYTLWIYVPQRQPVSGVTASAGDRRPVTVTYFQDGNTLKVTFRGESEPVDWEVAFARDGQL